MMMKLASLSVVCWCMLSLNIAYAAPEKSKPATDELSVEEQLSKRLDAFFYEAVEGGLLQSGKQGTAEAPGMTGASEPSQVTKKPDTYNCEAGGSLNFSGYSDIKSYGDLMLYVEKYEEEMKTGSKDAALAIAKAYIALGLYAEGRLLFEKIAKDESIALVKLSDLLEQHKRPDISFFRTHAACDPNAQIWLATALLYEGETEGAAILGRTQNNFRSLPLQMRIDVTTIAIPELDRSHKRDLARVLFASFSPEEIEGASRLSFSQALLDASEGKASIEEVMQEYMVHPEYRAAAAAALIRYNKPVPAADRDVLLEELVQDLSNVEGSRDIPLKLKIAFQQMSALSDYSQLHDLVVLPGLQSPQAKNELRKQFVSILEKDMQSEESVRALAVIEAMLSHQDLLVGQEALPALYKDSVEFANAQGYLSLAGELTRHYGYDDAVLAADLAYREKDAETLYALADEHADNREILLWAAMTAVERNDSRQLQKLQQDLPLDVDTIVPLIEADALSGNWVVPYAFYVAAGELKTAENEKKIQQILDLRQRERTGQDRVRNTGISHATDVLKASAETLSEIQGEASR